MSAGQAHPPPRYPGKSVLGDPEETRPGSEAAGEDPVDRPGAAGPRPRAALATHVPYSSPRPLVAVRLDTNESPYPPPGALRAGLARLAGTHDWHRYGDLDATALRERLAGLHGRTAEGVWVAGGSFELLAQLLAAFAGPGRTLGVAEPAWGGYRQVAAATATTVVGGRDGGGADVVVVCSPHNPGGHTIPAGTVARLCADHPGSLVVVDEAYGEFSAQPSAAGLLDRFANLVVARTFSKALALADLRLGYLLALGYLDEVAATVALVRQERQRLHDALGGLAGVRVRPSEANFLCFATPLPSQVVRRGLLARGVAVRDVAGLAHLPGRLRVTVGAPADNQVFLAALGEVLA